MIRSNNKKNHRKDTEDNKTIHVAWQQFSVKTASLEKYSNNLKGMLPLVHDMFRIYNAEFYKKVKFTAYIRRQKTYTKICKEFDKTPKIIGWGDGCGTRKGIKGKKSPCKELRKMVEKLCKNVVLVDVDEYKSTKMCSSCCEETGEVYVQKKYIKDGVEKSRRQKIYGLRRCKNQTCGITWDRDVNGARNILKILKHMLSETERPVHLRRDPKPTSTSKEGRDATVGNVAHPEGISIRITPKEKKRINITKKSSENRMFQQM